MIKKDFQVLKIFERKEGKQKDDQVQKGTRL
jgi:hypothetical protein